MPCANNLPYSSLKANDGSCNGVLRAKVHTLFLKGHKVVINALGANNNFFCATYTEVKLRALVNSISDYDYTLTFSNSRKERHPGTGQWLFERPDFKQWVENTTTGTILWCHGIRT